MTARTVKATISGTPRVVGLLDNYPTAASPSDMVDTLDIPFLSSNQRASSYHVYAANLPYNAPVGLVIQLHGDDAFEYHNPTSTYSYGGTSGHVNQARYRNMIFVGAWTPDRVGTETWWEAGTANSIYLRDLILYLYRKYPNINRRRVYFATHSGGSQQLAQYFMPAHSSVLRGGGAFITGGGGVPLVYEQSYAAGLLSRFRMKWYTGLLDNGTVEANSPGLYDALSDSQAAAPYYAGKGFTTVLANPSGVDHNIDTTTAGFGPIFGQWLHTVDAAAVATTTSATRDTTTAATWTGTVTNAPAVTFRVSSSAFGTQAGIRSTVAVDFNTRVATATISTLTAGVGYFWQVEIGGSTTHGTVLTSGTVPSAP